MNDRIDNRINDIATAMKLNHLSFPTNDLAATTRFFVEQLGCTATQFPGLSMVKRPGFDIVIEEAEGFTVAWPHNFHIGFELPTVADVQAVYARFEADGVEMKTELVHAKRGTRFFCQAPGGLLLEITTRADADAAVRASLV